MRRVALAAISALMVLALVAPSTMAAQSTSFVAKASAARPGGVLHLGAKAKHPTWGATFSVSATVHFASGDVSVDLHRRGRSYVALGRVAVPADQPLGRVAVDVTVTYDGVAYALPPFNARIVAHPRR